MKATTLFVIRPAASLNDTVCNVEHDQLTRR